MVTSGDKQLKHPLNKVGGKGLFTKELEEALLQNKADIAVHSMKDVPLSFPEDLGLGAICQRENPADTLLMHSIGDWKTLPLHARVGTASLRRRSQLLALRPDLNIIPLRGNLQTRCKKLEEKEYEAIILAAAGLERLQIHQYPQYVFSPEEMLPAIGQGALGIECRLSDAGTLALLEPLDHLETSDCIQAERSMNAALNGGCQIPIAGFAELNSEILTLKGLVADVHGHTLLKHQQSAHKSQALVLGQQVAHALLAQGAEDLLEQARRYEL